MIPKVLVRHIQHTANFARAQGVSNSTVHTVAAKNLATPVEMRVSPPSHTRTWAYLIPFESYSRVE